MKLSRLGLLSIPIAVMLSATAFVLPAQAGAIKQSSGKLTLLRVHNVGTKYGPPADQIDAEVIIRLNSQPGKAFGFKLRQDSNALVHQGMLDVLRDAFFRNTNVTIDYDIESGKKNGRIIRVWVSK
ncbi:MAG: hypothetical protein QNJ63_14935 [Calothrix sp. MO_192.B10]|nr:hypothetical protein [Calothrix sp. MO_192.B10]